MKTNVFNNVKVFALSLVLALACAVCGISFVAKADAAITIDDAVIAVGGNDSYSEIKVGDVLSVDLTFSDSGYEGTDVVYGWDVADTDSETVTYDKASDPTYTITAADVGKYIYVKVVGGDVNVAATSEQEAVTSVAVSNGIASVTLDNKSGIEVGDTLSAAVVFHNDSENSSLIDSVTYAWYTADNAGGTNEAVISGASAASFELTANEKGKHIIVKATYEGVTVFDATTDAIADVVVPPVVLPTLDSVGITGTVAVGQTLTADPVFSAAGSYTGITYQWARSKNSATGFANIASATNATYEIAAGDMDYFIRVTVSADGTDVETGSVSAVTASEVVLAAPVAPIAIDEVAIVNVNGGDVPVVGQKIKAVITFASTDAPYTEDVLLEYVSYVWYAAAEEGAQFELITDATDAEYTVTAEQLGYFFKVEVIGMDGFVATTLKSAETVNAAEAAPVQTWLEKNAPEWLYGAISFVVDLTNFIDRDMLVAILAIESALILLFILFKLFFSKK